MAAITTAITGAMAVVGIMAGRHLQSAQSQGLLLPMPITGQHLFITHPNMFIHSKLKLQLIALRTDSTIPKPKLVPVVGKGSFIELSLISGDCL
jgi:hypothetical protein